MNKLEKVALRLSREKGRPLVLVINNIHLFKNNEDAQKLLLQLQQRAESWAESRKSISAELITRYLMSLALLGIMTMVFTSYVHFRYAISIILLIYNVQRRLLAFPDDE
jgi:hypothetical protein